jgi:anaphase-promoting complex subunit 3
MSLQLDPFLFTSFQALAELGETTHLDASTVFGGKAILKDITNINQYANVPPASALDHGTTTATTKTPLQPMLSTPMMPSSHYLNTTNKPGFTSVAANVYNTNGRVIRFETPGLTPIAHNMTTSAATYDRHNHNNNNMNQSMTPVSSETITKLSQQQMRHLMMSNETTTTVMKRANQIVKREYYPPSPDTSTPVLATAATPVTRVTRSMRYLRGLGTSHADETAPPNSSIGANRSLFPSSTSENKDSNNSGSTNLSKPFYNTFNNVNSKNNDVKGSDLFMTHNKPEKIEKDDTIQEILNILTIVGTAYHNLCQYRCRDTIQILQRLPISQQRTTWVLHQQGRAFLEQGDFVSAQRCFEYMHSIDPGRMQGLELLSTVYWQLKKEVDLANLAQRTMDWDFKSPQAHCVAGNCFSLQKDQETALVFFKRSLQLDPNFTYIHTLSGYEYMANEDFGKATSCFRKALQIDDRHYNAWYGLGMIYYRQEKYDLAEYHFDRAVNIHPNSGVLRCNLGMAQNANGKAYVALETLSEAFRLDPRNPQARFQRATIYSSLHRPDEALAELKIVRDAAPREATVHFAMGKILKRLGRLDEAMKCFLIAMDLDPKDNQMIKSAMDKLGEPDGEEDGTTSY